MSRSWVPIALEDLTDDYELIYTVVKGKYVGRWEFINDSYETLEFFTALVDIVESVRIGGTTYYTKTAKLTDQEFDKLVTSLKILSTISK